MENTITINIDFDGTCVTHNFPDIGKEIGAAPVLKTLTDNGHKLVLFTMRSDTTNNPNIVAEKKDFLKPAVDWFASHNIPLYGIQENPTQKSWTTSPKSYAQLMIDDSALGCPLTFDLTISDRPFVDWIKVSHLLFQRGLITYEQVVKLTANK